MSKHTELLNQLIAGSAGEVPPFVTTLGMPSPKGWEPGRVWIEWDADPKLFHGGEAVFGGFIAALADSALLFPAWTVLNDDESITTSDLRVSFFKPVPLGLLQIEARVVNRGRRMVHVEATFTREDGKLAAVATATLLVVRSTT